MIMGRPLFPIITWDRCDLGEADEALERWQHWLGACNRPFGRQAFGLRLDDELVAIAVSASTVNGRCGGYARREVVELARLCAHPDHRDLTRVALRLWRKTSPREWSDRYWPVRACVSYSNRTRHTGDIYRFDGWRKVCDVPGGGHTGGWSRKKSFEAKTVWAFDLVAEGVGPVAVTLP